MTQAAAVPTAFGRKQEPAVKAARNDEQPQGEMRPAPATPCPTPGNGASNSSKLRESASGADRTTGPNCDTRPPTAAGAASSSSAMRLSIRLQRACATVVPVGATLRTAKRIYMHLTSRGALAKRHQRYASSSLNGSGNSRLQQPAIKLVERASRGGAYWARAQLQSRLDDCIA